MHSKHYYLIGFAVLVALGIGLYSYAAMGYFPIAIVNSEMIYERQYQKSLSAVLNYTEAASKTYANLNLDELMKNKQDVRRLVLEEEIENKIVHEELQRRLGSGLSSVIDGKLATVDTGSKLAQAATTLYGISFQDYIDLFLRPVAEKEILDGKLFAENAKLDDWLSRAKQNANVVILVPEYSWENGKVK